MEASTWYLIGSIILGILSLIAGFSTGVVTFIYGLSDSGNKSAGTIGSLLTIALLSGCIYCGYQYGHVPTGGGVVLLDKGSVYETLCLAKDSEVVYATVKNLGTGEVTLCSLTKEPPKMFTKTQDGTLVAIEKEK